MRAAVSRAIRVPSVSWKWRLIRSASLTFCSASPVRPVASLVLASAHCAWELTHSSPRSLHT